MSSLTLFVSFDFLMITVLLSQAAASVFTLRYEMKTANAECL